MDSSPPVPPKAATLRLYRLRVCLSILLLFTSALCFFFASEQVEDTLLPLLPYRCDMRGQPDSLFELFSSSGVGSREDVLGLVVRHHDPSAAGGDGLPPCPKAPWPYREIPTLGAMWTWWWEERPASSFEEMPVLYGWGRQVYFYRSSGVAPAPVEDGDGDVMDGCDPRDASSL